MSLYLYGIIEQTKAVSLKLCRRIDFGPIGFKGGRVFSLPAGGIAAVVGPPPAEIFAKLGKELLVAFLLAHQQTLETIMKRSFVLPFKFGTTLKDESEITRILEEGRRPLADIMSCMKDHTEIDVIATWDVQKNLQEMAEKDPEIAACKKKLAHSHADMAFVGMLLSKALKQRATKWKGEITRALSSHSIASAPHDLLNDTMVFNSSFLIPHQGEKDFMTGLEKMDAHFQGKLTFKCVGPLPPYSFATIMIKRFDPVQIQQAAVLLHLNGQAELLELKKIYRQLSRESHPDRCPELSQDVFENINKAYEVIADYCKDGPKSLERSAVENFTRLEICSQPEASYAA